MGKWEQEEDLPLMRPMGAEEKAQAAAEMARDALHHPLVPIGARRAIQAMADALEAVAHEVEILKIRMGAEK